MAYGVYYKDKTDRTFARAGEIVTATRGRFKGGNIFKDYRFDTLEAAQEKAKYYESKGYVTKIKEVK